MAKEIGSNYDFAAADGEGDAHTRELEAARTKLRRLREVMNTIANYSDAAAHAARLAENAPAETGRDAAYTDMTTKIRNALARTDVCP